MEMAETLIMLFIRTIVANLPDKRLKVFWIFQIIIKTLMHYVNPVFMFCHRREIMSWILFSCH